MRLGESGARVVFGLAGALAFAALLAGRLTAQEPSTLALLDQYAAGKFADVNATLARTENFKRIYKDLKHDDVKAWLAAGGPQDRRRRELAAATFALEAARADEWYEWKWWLKPAEGRLPVLYWMPPPLLIEWGCELLRQNEQPNEGERLWQLAAMATAQRSEDNEFLIGFTSIEVDDPAFQEPLPTPNPTPLAIPPGLPLRGSIVTRGGGGDRGPEEVLNVQKEIGHLNHVVERFPDEKRFQLGQALARESRQPSEASKLYQSLANDPMVGGEAAVRLGALFLRRGGVPSAIQMFARAETLTRDRDIVYLARFYRGQALLRSRQEDDAAAAFRAALAARPGSQSASAALAVILARHDQRAEAQTIMKAVLDAGADYRDPHIEYVHSDDRFWPVLIVRLQKEIAR